MEILVKGSHITFPGSKWDGKTCNVLIKNGKIARISESEIKGGDKVLEGDNLYLSPGWFDLRSYSGDPGYEVREDLQSLSEAASAGGFTEVAVLPDTNPVTGSKDLIHYVLNRSASFITSFYPIAAVTEGLKGTAITEMLDLHHHGAVAFSDGDMPIWHTDVMLRSLQYLQTVNGLLMNRPEDRMLSEGGQMNEGKVSTRLGLKGIPDLAEELVVERDLRILEYTGGKLHFSKVSTPGSLEKIKKAKRKGLQVTCDIAFYTLSLSDSELKSFDTNLKVNPPLRPESELKQLWKGVSSGIIDAVVSDHMPWDIESKKVEFDHAGFGMIGLEAVFPVLNNCNMLSVEKLVEMLTVGPRNVLGLSQPVFEEGATANLTIFDPSVEYTFTGAHLKSRSANCPFVGKKVKGKVVAVFNKNKKYFSAE